MQRVSLAWMFLYGAGRVGVGIHDIFYNAVAGFYLASYGLPNWAIGFLANERSFIGSPLLPIFGAISDRLRTPLGRRKPFMLLIAVVVAGFLILIARPDTWLVVLIFLLGPLCLGVAVTAYEVLLPDAVVPEQRGTANGINRALGFASGMGLLVVAFQTWEQQPAIVFTLVAVSLAAGFAITLLGIREAEPPTEPTSSGERPAGGRGALAAIPARAKVYVQGIATHREAAKYVACYFFYWFGIGGITPFINRFGHEELGIPEGETFLLLLAVMITTLLFAAPAGILGDRLGKKPVMSWGIIAFALLIAVGSQVQTREHVILVLAAAGFAQAVPTVLAYPLFTELVPGERMGELTGLSVMVWSLAQPLGATAFGGLADVTGTLRSVLLGGAIALVVAWAILLTVRVPATERGVAAQPAGLD